MAGQLARWAGDPLLTELVEVHRAEDRTNPITDSWITLGFPSPVMQELAR